MPPWLMMASLILAACSSPGDEPSPAAQPRSYRPPALPAELAAIAEFCAVPRDEPAPALPAGSRLLAAERLNLGGAPFPVALRCVLRTRSQQEQVWKLLSPRPVPPPVPEGHMVVLATSGAISSDGHDIEIRGVWVSGDTATVLVRERTVGNGCDTGQIEIYPASAVRLPSVAVVRFREELLEGEECD